MNIRETKLPGVLIFEPRVYEDGRGFFLETFRQDAYTAAGIDRPFLQDNMSSSNRGVLRGLHFQNPRSQGKLVQVVDGSVFDVAVDIRLGSPTFGEWVGEVLTSKDRNQIYVPVGFAHGFYVLSERAVVSYKCTDYYDPSCEASVLWNDPEIGIEWPDGERILGPKDVSAPRLSELSAEKLTFEMAISRSG